MCAETENDCEKNWIRKNLSQFEVTTHWVKMRIIPLMCSLCEISNESSRHDRHDSTNSLDYTCEWNFHQGERNLHPYTHENHTENWKVFQYCPVTSDMENPNNLKKINKDQREIDWEVIYLNIVIVHRQSRSVHHCCWYHLVDNR